MNISWQLWRALNQDLLAIVKMSAMGRICLQLNAGMHVDRKLLRQCCIQLQYSFTVAARCSVHSFHRKIGRKILYLPSREL